MASSSGTDPDQLANAASPAAQKSEERASRAGWHSFAWEGVTAALVAEQSNRSSGGRGHISPVPSSTYSVPSKCGLRWSLIVSDGLEWSDRVRGCFRINRDFGAKMRFLPQREHYSIPPAPDP